MAERWQQWMPHDIDSWQGSANVQALSDLAYRAVHNLILDMWKQADCALPDDDRELAKRSRVAVRWSECRDEVREYFTDRTDDGKITHRVTLKKWNEAREVYEKRQSAAKKTNESRSAHGDRNGDRDARPTVTERTPSRSADTGTSTGTETSTRTQQGQQPSGSPLGDRSKKSKRERTPDPRHAQFQEAFGKYFTHKNTSVTQAPWDAQEASHLGRFLKKNPEFTIDQWQRLLRNRGNSPVSHGDSLSAWIGRALNWADGPTDAYGKQAPGGTNGNSVGTYKSKTESSMDAAREAIRIIRARGTDRDGADQAGYTPAGQVGDGGLPRLGSGSGLV